MPLTGQYPMTWGEYVGQDIHKENLKLRAGSAALRGERMPHTLISSPIPGIGKTALALLTIREAGSRFLAISGGVKVTDALRFFEDCRDGDTIFYDEFHQIANGGPKNQEWMLHYLENGKILTPYGEEDVPQVTFICATTDPGMILPTVLDRFMRVELDPYTSAEAALIALQLAGKVLGPANLPTISHEVAVQVAAAGDNQPRRMRDLLFALRDLAVVGQIKAPTDGSYPLERPLMFAGLTEDGLTKEAVAYLTMMRSTAGREPMGESLIKARLGYGRGNGMRMVEEFLVRKGYIAHTNRGRMLTSAGSTRAKQLTA